MAQEQEQEQEQEQGQGKNCAPRCPGGAKKKKNKKSKKSKEPITYRNGCFVTLQTRPVDLRCMRAI